MAKAAAPVSPVPGRARARLPSSQPAAGRPRLRGAQWLIHAVLLLLGWVGFVWMWWQVAGRPWDSADLVVLIAASLIALPTVTLLWVVHNIALHRRKGPRTHSAVVFADYPNDWNGREVKADWAAVRAARIVVIEVVDGAKHYRAAGQ